MTAIDKNAANTVTSGRFARVHYARHAISQHVKSHKQTSRYTAMVLFCIAFDLQATLPLDKIYGLYSALKMLGMPLVDPDYTRTPGALFEDVTRAWMTLSQGDLSILQLAARAENVAPELPSWVPPWYLSLSEMSLLPYRGAPGMKLLSSSAPTMRRSYWDSLIRQDVSTAASSSSSGSSSRPEEAFRSAQEPGKLRLHGRRMGRLEYSRSCRAAVHPEEIRSVHRDWCLHAHKHDPTGSSMAAALTLLGGSYAPTPASFDSWFEVMIYPERPAASASGEDGSSKNLAITSHSMDERPWVVQPDTPASRAAVTARISPAMNAITTRRPLRVRALCRPFDAVRRECAAAYPEYSFCVLDDGTMGVADPWTRAGDEVFLLPGAQWPVVLRRKDDGSSYSLVGEARIQRYQGLDEGELQEVDLVELTLV